MCVVVELDFDLNFRYELVYMRFGFHPSEKKTRREKEEENVCVECDSIRDRGAAE